MYMQPGTSIADVVKQNSFTEPRLVIFTSNEENSTQGFILAEKLLFFEVPEFTILNGIVSLIAAYYCYYVSYPKPVAARMFLLFVQEVDYFWKTWRYGLRKLRTILRNFTIVSSSCIPLNHYLICI